MKKKIETVKTLLESLPFIKKFNNKIFVIKYGGSAQTSPVLKEKFAQDILLLYLMGIKPVVVHGGGKKITEMLNNLQIVTEFIDGQRVTDDKTMEIVEMVLSGSVNKEIVSLINHFGAKAMGVSGKDGNLIKAVPYDFEKYGRVGKVQSIDPNVIYKLLDEKFVPVIAPIGSSDKLGDLGYNINADFAASAIAKELRAEKLIFLTDTMGILDENKNLIESATNSEIQKLKDKKIIYGGMIPKVDACLEAINNGVQKAHIIDGRIENAILLETFTSEGIGTEILKNRD
jgi:acetylglutamate kinase